MATLTLSKAAATAGHRVSAFFHTIFLYILDAFRAALNIFSPITGQKHATPNLPVTAGPAASSTSSAAAFVSSPSSPRRSKSRALNGDSDIVETITGSMSTTTVTSPSRAGQPPRAPPPRRFPVPNIIPALPRIAPPKKENVPPPTQASSSADPVGAFTNGVTRLRLNPSGAVGEERAPPAAQVGGVEQVAAQNGGRGISGNVGPGTRVEPTPNATQPVPQSLPQTSGINSAVVANSNIVSNGNVVSNGIDTGVAARGLPVTVAPAAISQTSRLRETPVEIQVADDNADGKEEVRVLTPEEEAEIAYHSQFMEQALDMARLALKTNETPVGCVLVYKGQVIAKGMNATNITRNGTRHAELMAITSLLSRRKASNLAPARMPLSDKTNQQTIHDDDPSTWPDVDPEKNSHVFPYGQKFHPSPCVDKSILQECTLYVTVEPCVMCASLLRQYKIKNVLFGAVNDKFGGTGGVFRIHKNSPFVASSAPPTPMPQNGKGSVRPVMGPRAISTVSADDGQASSSGDDSKSEHSNDAPYRPLFTPLPPTPNLPGDGGNIERGYEVEGGWGRDDAVTLLRQFYVQENGRAPVPRKKEGRAARLAAMMQRDGHAGGPMLSVPKVKGGNGSALGDNEAKATVGAAANVGTILAEADAKLEAGETNGNILVESEAEGEATAGIDVAEISEDNLEL
ncbi:hypothetical protein B0T24DRAFT_682306 [Lasiosphaeria ovina]|uniref:CMP/dCMP-type deaminase domain-containing protein n=1 Tax=Lasiosphaeria ovina TaxID=92902 RepID=A0AAE0N1V8_9PEZI|nr:hypothetical protein B0T24DRAFT_682306 [Lasiosphaeria ovina]